jgi:4-nitrophenol 2-monooxygenase / 4-nitrocatechol 4-monooxygenase, reductase component
MQLEHGRFSQPLLPGALATVECRVVEEIVQGTHSVFLAEVEQATANGGRPLAYFRGRFGGLDFE